mmetsp:Transcript_21517/g.69470  ORF Transcript_21517/g.69470 Transcript_21517/m.69470 type:complete len:229 (+) Transcript_21517:423-1109(+)
MPTRSSVWPCALFTVIANAARTGNCRRHHSNGKRPFSGYMSMRGSSTMRPRCSSAPLMICASSSLLFACSFRAMSRVPLQSPSRGFRFRRSMSGMFGLMSSSCAARPLVRCAFRYSVGTLLALSPSAASSSSASALTHVVAVPGKLREQPLVEVVDRRVVRREDCPLRQPLERVLRPRAPRNQVREDEVDERVDVELALRRWRHAEPRVELDHVLRARDDRLRAVADA